MPINSREKGAAGERELANYLRSKGIEAKRGQQFHGGADSPDIMSDLHGVHIECKRVEQRSTGSLYDWMDQAERDAGPDKIPVVVHRRNRRRWVAILSLDEFLKLHRIWSILHDPSSED